MQSVLPFHSMNGRANDPLSEALELYIATSSPYHVVGPGDAPKAMRG